MIGKSIMTTILIGGLRQRKISKECRFQNRDIELTQQDPLLVPYDLLF